MKHVCITGVTFTGNKGGTSMLITAMESLRGQSAINRFDLLSIYPENDKKANNIPDLRIVSMSPKLLLLVLFPLSLVLWPLSRFKAGRKMLRLFPVYRSILECELVVDLSGIVFVDGRGLGLLVYNTAVCLPAILFNKKVCKLSQAMGPFKQKMNRRLAKYVLSRCEILVGRGEQTGRHLEELGFEKPLVLPDTAFAMKIRDEDKQTAHQLLAQRQWKSPGVVMCPSKVVLQYCNRNGIDFYNQFGTFIKNVRKEGWNVCLLPHSIAGKKSKNNDLEVCERLMEQFNDDDGVIAVTDDLDPRILRALIGEADVFVGSRFHSVISALATAVPPMVIGWSHKYLEVLAMFELQKYYVDFPELNAQNLTQRFREQIKQAPETTEKIKKHLPTVIRGAEKNFDMVNRRLKSNG